MVKHIVMWKIRTDLNSSVPEICATMKSKLEALRGKITELKMLEVGINSIKSDASMDIVLSSEFDNEAALQNYMVHPLHVEVGAYIKSVVAERKVVDYIF